VEQNGEIWRIVVKKREFEQKTSNIRGAFFKKTQQKTA